MTTREREAVGRDTEREREGEYKETIVTRLEGGGSILCIMG